MVIGKRNITGEKILELLDDGMEFLFPSKREVYARFYGKTPALFSKEYFPSVVLKTANRLERKGMVEKIVTDDGVVIKISEKGRKQLLKYKLEQLQPKVGKWDGKWRTVFFDVPQKQNSVRDRLRKYLKMLGMKEMQESVWVTPYDVCEEIKYIREVLEIPHAVKLAEMSYLENSEELREIFKV